MIEVHLEILLFVQKMAHGGGAEADVGKGGGGVVGGGGVGVADLPLSGIRPPADPKGSPFELF